MITKMASITVAACVATCCGFAVSAEPNSRLLDRDEARSALHTLLSQDVPQSAVVFVSEGGNPTVTREQFRRVAEQMFPRVPGETPEQAAKREKNIVNNAERLYQAKAGGRFFVNRFRSNAEGSRHDFFVFAAEDEIDSRVPPQQTMIVRPSLPLAGPGQLLLASRLQFVDHVTKRLVNIQSLPSDPKWLSEGGRTPGSLRAFIVQSLTIALKVPVEVGADPTDAMIDAFFGQPDRSASWQWTSSVEDAADGRVLLRVSQPNWKLPIVEVAFADATLSTVASFVFRDPVTGNVVFRREVQRTDDRGIPLEFWIENFKTDGSSVGVTRFYVEEWQQEMNRQNESPLVTEDLSQYKLNDR